MKNIIITTVVAATLSISSVCFADFKDKGFEKHKRYSVQQEEQQEGLEERGVVQAQ